MRNIFIFLITNFLLSACISYDVKQIDCSSIKEVYIINKTSDDTLPKSIMIVEPLAIKEFCSLINSRTFAGSVEVKDHSGFFDISVKMKNDDVKKFFIIHTHRYGVVIRSSNRYYRQMSINDFIYAEFQKRNENPQ